MIQAIVEIEGANGDVVHLTGPRAGEEGMYLGKDLEGILDPEVKTFWDETMDVPGATQTGHRYLPREVTIRVEVFHDDDGPDTWWTSRDTRYRKLFSYKKDALLKFTTEDGCRVLRVRLDGAHKVNTKTDPRGRSVNTITTHLKAGDPFWYGPDYTETKNLVGGSAEFTFENPTDTVVFPEWTIAPGASKITLPDGIPVDGVQRQVELPQLQPSDGTVCVFVDPRFKQLISSEGVPVLSRMGGRRLLNPLEEWTAPTQVVVTGTGLDTGEGLTLRLKRPYTMPWGMH